MEEKLRQHKLWLETKGEEGARASFSNLAGMDLKGMDLRGCDFYEADLRLTDFTGCDLRNARFEKANLEGAVLRRTNLENATFNLARLDYVNMSNADLKKTDFNCVTFVMANLSEVSAVRCNFKGSRFIGANITNSIIKDSVLEGVDFTGADISETRFESCRMLFSVFNNTRVEQTEFIDSDLRHIHNCNTEFKHAVMTGSDNKFLILTTKWGKLPVYIYGRTDTEYKALSLESFKFIIIGFDSITDSKDLTGLSIEDRNMLINYCKTVLRTKEMMAQFRGIKQYFSKKSFGN